MPFEKLEQEILTGGINLTPPADLIQRDQAETCLNFRVDQYGVLRSRPGMTVVDTGFEDYVHTLFLVESLPEKRRYVGADAFLYCNGIKCTDALTGGVATFNGEQLGVCSWAGKLWVMNKLKQGYADNTILYPWLPAAPEDPPAVAKTSGALGGTVAYYVTFSTDDEYESNPSPVSADIEDTAAAFGVTVSDIPISPNPAVTKRHIYREGGMLSAPYRVHTIEDNTTTSWTDDASEVNGEEVPAGETSDGIAVEDGYLLEDDHDPPPAAAVLAPTTYFNRILAGATDDHPNRLYWTPTNKVFMFPGSESDLEGNWVDLGELNEAIVAISPKPRMCIIYKEHSIWRITGDLSNGFIEQTNSDTGLIGRKAWTQAGLVDYFQGKEGIMQFNGDVAVKITLQLDPIFKGLRGHVGTPSINAIYPIDQLLRDKACMAVKLDRLYFSYPDQSP